VRLAFPVGPELKVWLAPDREVVGFRRDLETAAPGCAVRPLYPTLNDLVLRDLTVGRAETSHDA